jgi:phospholipid N-methyltransferase
MYDAYTAKSTMSGIDYRENSNKVFEFGEGDGVLF